MRETTLCAWWLSPSCSGDAVFVQLNNLRVSTCVIYSRHSHIPYTSVVAQQYGIWEFMGFQSVATVVNGNLVAPNSYGLWGSMGYQSGHLESREKGWVSETSAQ
jgi:hypothetical protein